MARIHFHPRKMLTLFTWMLLAEHWPFTNAWLSKCTQLVLTESWVCKSLGPHKENWPSECANQGGICLVLYILVPNWMLSPPARSLFPLFLLWSLPLPPFSLLLVFPATFRHPEWQRYREGYLPSAADLQFMSPGRGPSQRDQLPNGFCWSWDKARGR